MQKCKEAFGLFLILLLCYCCNSKANKGYKENNKKSDTIIVSVIPTEEKSKKIFDDLIQQIDSTYTENESIIEDCIFDQTTQTDDFLREIKALENYVWNSETKTAEIVLNDHWSLIIKRGGCDHFEFSALFVCDRILDINKENDKAIIFNKIVWITSLLEDFDGEAIKLAIDNDSVKLTREDEFKIYGNFMNEKLYELYYFNFNNKDRTTFEIGYYYN